MARPAGVRSGARKWWRSYFHDHPLLRSKDATAYTGIGGSARAKVYCKRCFEDDIIRTQVEEREQVRQGSRAVERDRTQVESTGIHPFDLG